MILKVFLYGKIRVLWKRDGNKISVAPVENGAPRRAVGQRAYMCVAVLRGEGSVSVASSV